MVSIRQQRERQRSANAEEDRDGSGRQQQQTVVGRQGCTAMVVDGGGNGSGNGIKQ
jgi:hypothetical protein